jgi:hypothetical protein
MELGQVYIWHGLVLQTHQRSEDEGRDGPWNVGFLPFNQLTRLVAREHFIIQSRHESYKSYKCTISFEFQVMRNLLCTHMGHSALYTMCKILQDPAAARDVRLLRGAVFHVNMGLWSTKKVGTLKCTPTSVLPSFLCVSKSQSAKSLLGFWKSSVF